MQPVEPLRQGVHPQRADVHREARRGVRHLCDNRRGVRAHRLRSERPYVLRDAPRDVGADDILLVALQDVLRDGVARRLHHSPGGDHGDRPQGPRFPDGGRSGASAGGPCHRSGVPGQLLQGSEGRVHGEEGAVPERAGRDRRGPQRPAGGVLRPGGRIRVRVRQRRQVLRGPCQEGGGRCGTRLELLQRKRQQPDPLAFR